MKSSLNTIPNNALMSINARLTPGKDSCRIPQYCLQFRLIIATIRHDAVFFDDTPGVTRPVSS